ncbi:hypothetical protein BDV18DRAFT_163868 [Aspergillus unguis]
MVEDQSSSITAASWSLGGISIVLVGLRLYIRVLVTRIPGWDDFFVAFALANAVVCSALAQVAVHYGLGMHISDIADQNDRTNAAKYTVLAPNFSVISSATGKLAVAFFLLRLLGQSARPWHRWFLYILSALSIAWNTFAVIAIIGFCRPAKKIWEPDTPGSCFPLQLQLFGGISQAAFNAVADLALAGFPLVVFRKVQLPLFKKIGVIGILGAGVFAAAATMVKCILLKRLPEHDDITWSSAPITTTWYTVEMYVIIICATLPTLPQVYNGLRHKQQSYYNSYDQRTARSTPKTSSFRLQRMPDASLFETVAGDRGSSQETILHQGKS